MLVTSESLVHSSLSERELKRVIQSELAKLSIIPLMPQVKPLSVARTSDFVRRAFTLTSHLIGDEGALHLLRSRLDGCAMKLEKNNEMSRYADSVQLEVKLAQTPAEEFIQSLLGRVPSAIAAVKITRHPFSSNHRFPLPIREEHRLRRKDPTCPDVILFEREEV